MNKDDTRKALLAPDEALIALGHEGLVKHREAAQAWVGSDFDCINLTYPDIDIVENSIDNPEWVIHVDYKLPEPEKWDCGIDFKSVPFSNVIDLDGTASRVISAELFQEVKKLIPLIKLNKLIEEKNKEAGWVADIKSNKQLKAFFYYDYTENKYDFSVVTDSLPVGSILCNPDKGEEVLNMLNNGLIKGIEK